MRWLLRSAVAAAGLGSVAPVAVAEPEVPVPMMPPVRPLPDDEPPPTGFVNGLPIPRPAPAAPGADVVPAAVWVPAASPAKPAPPVLVQNAVPTRADEPAERPDRLPDALPVAPARPAPPGAANTVPPIPVAPTTGAPGTKTPPVASLPPAKLSETGFPLASVPARPAADQPAAFPPVVAPPALVASSAAAAGACAPCRSCPTARVAELVRDPVWRLCPQDAPVRVRGWLDGGYVYNPSNPTSKFNGPYNSVDRAGEPMFNQAYLIVDHALPTDGNFGAGFRVDALFGYDAFLAQSRGLEVDRDANRRWNGQYYGLALPQAYAEVGNDVVSLKVGHFYTNVGYEVLPATGNFFYSHAYSYQFGQPFTHWGALLTTQLTRNWQVQAGLVNGWDALVGRANNVNVLGGLKYTPDAGWWWSSLTLVSGQEQNNGAGLPNVSGTDGNRTRYSFLLGLTPGGPCGRWEYVFHHYYGWQENGTPQLNFARWYGIDQYLFYRVSKSVRLGTRVEWFRDEDGTRVGLNRPANPNKPPLPGNYFSLTAGLNYTPCANFAVRPEVRWDFTSDTSRPAFSDGRKNNQLLLGCDLIWQF